MTAQDAYQKWSTFNSTKQEYFAFIDGYAAADARIAELEAKLKEFERVGWQRKSNTFGWVDVENDQLDRAIQAGCEIREVFAIPKLKATLEKPIP